MADDRDTVLNLMKRYNQIGALLPSEHDIRHKPQAIATAKLVLREMQEAKAEIDRLLGITGE